MAKKNEAQLSQRQSARDTRRWYWANHDKAKARKREAMRQSRASDPDKHRAISKAMRLRRRARLLELYGSSCVLCGFEDRRALTLDHVQRNGQVERAAFGEQGVYNKALSEFRPDLYRTLCMNCQFITRSQP